MKPQSVYLIVDPNWKGSLPDLSKVNHVWIIQTPANSDIIDKAQQVRLSVYCQSKGVTSFKARNQETAVMEMISAIDAHHSGFKSEDIGAWIEIRVLGMPWEDKLRRIISDQIPEIVWTADITDEGFIIRRSSQ